MTTSLRNTPPDVRANFLAYLTEIPFTAEHRPPLCGEATPWYDVIIRQSLKPLQETQP